jgi:hypothetical protein
MVARRLLVSILASYGSDNCSFTTRSLRDGISGGSGDEAIKLPLRGDSNWDELPRSGMGDTPETAIFQSF